VIAYEQSDSGWVATCEVRVGIERRTVRLDLGRLPSPPRTGGLRGLPVLVVPGDSIEVARAGALRAGAMPTVFLVDGDAPRLGGQFLTADAEGVEVVLVADGGEAALTTARALGATAILAAPEGDPASIDRTLSGLGVDVQVAIPALEDDRRARMRGTVTAALEAGHHPVEVDPRPAFAHLGVPMEPASPEDVAAAAGGVLAGRVAVARRRWR
jgi:hypothetical protein